MASFSTFDASSIEIPVSVTNKYDTFFEFIYKNCLSKMDDLEFRIILNKNLSCSQRHRIHTYTRGKDFYGITDHTNNFPVMTIFISYKFYKELHDKYSVPVVVPPRPPAPVVDNFKKLAFQKHIELLEELYPVEFAAFFK
jgi:hypothetical protein